MKAIYNGFRYTVLEKKDDFVILEGVGGYTFKAYMENIMFEEEPVDELPSERPDDREVLKSPVEEELPSNRDDKSLVIQEMPWVETPDGGSFDMGIEEFNRHFGPEPSLEKKEAFTHFIGDIFSGKKVEFPVEVDETDKLSGYTIQLLTPEDKESFVEELHTQNFPLMVKKYIGANIDEVLSQVTQSAIAESDDGSMRFWETSNPDLLNEAEQQDIKQIALHPDLVDAIKTVYSIRGAGPRNGEYDPELAAGMLKRAGEIIKYYDKQPLTPETFLQKVLGWLKISGERGKGRKVNGLDELYGEILSDIESDYKGKEDPETPDETPQGEPKMNPKVQSAANQIFDNMEGKAVSPDQLAQVAQQLSPEEQEELKAVIADAGVTIGEPTDEVPDQEPVEELDECGVAAVAGAGVADGSVNQATDGVQGIAIRPSRMGEDIRKRLEEEVGKIDELDVPLGLATKEKPNKFTRYKDVDATDIKALRHGEETQKDIEYRKSQGNDPSEVETNKFTKPKVVAEEFGDDNYTGLDDENPWNVTADETEERREENEKRRLPAIDEMRDKIKSIMDTGVMDEEFEFEEDGEDEDMDSHPPADDESILDEDVQGVLNELDNLFK